MAKILMKKGRTVVETVHLMRTIIRVLKQEVALRSAEVESKHPIALSVRTKIMVRIGVRRIAGGLDLHVKKPLRTVIVLMIRITVIQAQKPVVIVAQNTYHYEVVVANPESARLELVSLVVLFSHIAEEHASNERVLSV